MADADIALMAHLLRRAGFGATREELEAYVAKGYDATVEELLHPENAPPALEDDDLLRRYHLDQDDLNILPSSQTNWLYRLVNTRRPLEDKIGLFWHGVFATANTKLCSPRIIVTQVSMFRRCGLGSFRTLLLELSKNAGMLFWLDNTQNHRDAVNENFGRELLELFSMGVGNYTEDDVRECSRAFTGWTIRNEPLHALRAAQDIVYPFGPLEWQFEYREENHDDGEKTFLGHTGRFNGEDIIDIICRHPATANFVARHLYNFFVADEAQVPAWQDVPPRDPRAIEALSGAFVESGYEIRSVLRVLFNSDFFKEASFAKVKSPTELVVGTVRMTGGHRFPSVDDITLTVQTTNMGQSLLDPPSVEGWHTGTEWITTGSLVDRVNFASQQFADIENTGVRSMGERVKALGALAPEGLVDACLDLMGPLSIPEDIKRELVAHITSGGHRPENGEGWSTHHILQTFQLIAGTREFQLA